MKNIASCDLFLAGLRPLVLNRPSGPDASTFRFVIAHVVRS
jgi:hypothetical protein